MELDFMDEDQLMTLARIENLKTKMAKSYNKQVKLKQFMEVT